jgi:GTP-binding protein
MQSEFIYTLADVSQFSGFFQGKFMKGYPHPRIAMVGRSNVGKSSLINGLLEAKLARTSGEPGKTRAIHFYLWKKAGKIVADLPGYGYAKAARTDREKWEKFIDRYLKEETNLERVLLLLDARHGPTDNDRDAIEFLSLRRIPVTFVFTKIDTLKTQSERVKRQREAKEALNALGVHSESVFWVSSESKVGLKQLSQALSLPE